MNKFLKVFGLFRYLIACLVALIAFVLISQVTKFLHLPSSMEDISYVQLIQILWNSKEWYFRFLVCFNFILKPLFAFYLALVIFDVLNEK